MRFDRKIVIRTATVVGIGLTMASSADAQKVCKHIGRWTLVNGNYVCAGEYTGGQCVWTDDCRVNVE